jgi:SAM-dependent methyltransferase
MPHVVHRAFGLLVVPAILAVAQEAIDRPGPRRAPTMRGVGDDTGTWHYGLIARWWAEFNAAEPAELAYLRAAIERFGQPALDLGCGTGRLLIPLLAMGFDIDGVDISADVLALAEAAARRENLTTTLTAQALHELDLPRTYRTIYAAGVFGIGGRRDRDREALRRVYRHLEPGGVFIFDVELPYNERTEESWARWLAGHRGDLPRPWRETGERRRTADGDDIELISRLAAFDPLTQVHRLEMRARLWHDGAIIAEEEDSLLECLYFAREVAGMLEAAGFAHVAIEGRWTSEPATADDGTIVFIGRRPR